MPTWPWREEPAQLEVGSLASWKGQEETAGTLTFSGACPRCADSFTSNVSANAVVVTAAATGEARFDAATFFQCACADFHADRPTTKTRGCGTYWVARPKKDDVGDRYHLEVVTQPELVAAAKLVAEEAVAANAGLRTLAEKWIPGIAAITGILGLASVVVSKDSVDALDWGWRGGAFAFVALAVLTAAGATALVYRAAFGWPKHVELASDDQVLAAAVEIGQRNTRIASDVRKAVTASCVALVALLIALAILWLQPDSAAQLRVTYGDAGDEVSLCGKVAEVDGGALRLEVVDGSRTTTERIDLDTVTKLEPVPSCGG